jgi:hypothetical protein
MPHNGQSRVKAYRSFARAWLKDAERDRNLRQRREFISKGGSYMKDSMLATMVEFYVEALTSGVATIGEGSDSIVFRSSDNRAHAITFPSLHSALSRSYNRNYPFCSSVRTNVEPLVKSLFQAVGGLCKRSSIKLRLRMTSELCAAARVEPVLLALNILLCRMISTAQPGEEITVFGRKSAIGKIRLSLYVHAEDGDRQQSLTEDHEGVNAIALLLRSEGGTSGYDHMHGIGSCYWIELPAALN